MSSKKNKRSFDRNQCHSTNSSFVFGLILGAIIGAFIAILIYRHDKGKVFENLQEKLKKFFQDLANQQETKDKKTNLSTFEKTPKVNKLSPPSTKATTNKKIITFVKKKSSPKMFIKSKK